MGASNVDGPAFIYGNTAAIPLAIAGNTAVGDYNSDAGPNGVFQGDGVIDPRFIFPKDQVQGQTGKAVVHFSMPYPSSIAQIPVAAAAANIASVAGVTSGTAVALAAANVLGVTLNVPIVPISAMWNAQAPVVAAIALDFGFEFANCTAGTALVTVANAFDFSVGMPLVIGGVGNAAGTIPLLCNVLAINSTTTITLTTPPLFSLATAPVGMGNIWGPSEVFSQLANMTPTAAQPFMAGGPGLFLDGRQAVTRGLRVVGASGGTGGTFTVTGWDLYGMPMHETITVGAGAVTGYGVKAWKYISQIMPNFTDASHAYTFGTSDVFGFAYRAPLWESTDVAWNGLSMTSNVGYTAPLSLLTTATATTADVRGTVQTSALGPLGSGIGATASSGTVSGLAMTGARLSMAQTIQVWDALHAFPGSLTTVAPTINVPNPASLFGNVQF
jgi:hypothetical protein